MDRFEIEGDEVIEREVKATGNGAHVYLPKEWLDHTVKVVRVPQEPQFEDCAVCNRVTANTVEWCWLDDSGGAFFQICSGCRSEVKNQPEDACAICRENREASKSEGFGPVGPDTNRFAGCDTCRSRVIFDNQPSAQPVWIE